MGSKEEDPGARGYMSPVRQAEVLYSERQPEEAYRHRAQGEEAPTLVITVDDRRVSRGQGGGDGIRGGVIVYLIFFLFISCYKTKKRTMKDKTRK